MITNFVSFLVAEDVYFIIVCLAVLGAGWITFHD